MMGFGYGNSGLRMFRIGLIVLVVLAGVIFHHHGSTYNAIRIVYYVLIVGFLVFGITMRRRRGAGGRPGSRSQAPVGTMGPAGSATTGGPAPGWYAEAGQAGHERYWDGQSWGARRRLEGTDWVVDG